MLQVQTQNIMTVLAIVETSTRKAHKVISFS